MPSPKDIYRRTAKIKRGIIYHQIIAERATASEATEARFRLAELHFLSGQIDQAQTLLNAVLKTDVNRDIINDTIALSALLQEGQRADSTLLSAYASACLKLRQKDQNGALRAFETLHRAHPQSFLADRLLDHQAKIYADQKRYPQALQTYRKLIATQPESPLSPAAYIAQGAIYDKYLGQYYDAQKIYETLLVNYPLSLEADIARERLRKPPDKKSKSSKKQRKRDDVKMVHSIRINDQWSIVFRWMNSGPA